MIDLIIGIEYFEKKCVIIKGLLQSDQLKQHMVTIGIYQSLSNSEMYQHGCLENIKKLYTSVVKWDNQQQYKYIIETAMVSTPERFTDNSTISTGISVTVRNPIARESLRLFTEFLNVKNKAAVCRVCADKSKRKSIRAGSMLW